ncbi:MAG: HAD family phosphatase [Deltaproteobacteria bacterium]|nr:HAD family phosphatase [Deltaproteobacteria bacterium]
MKEVAAVFDMDGTLVDNMGLHGIAWMEMARRLGVSGLTVEVFEQHYAGKKNDEIFPDLLKRPVPDDEGRKLAWEKEALYREMAAGKLKPMPGLLPFLDLLRARSIPIAVATAATPENRALAFEALELKDRVDVVVGAEDVTRGKPAPDIFLAAAKKLGIDPARCVAFEDGKNGVLSAIAAGMSVVGVVTTTPAAILLAAGCFCTLTDFGARPPELDAKLFL